MTSLHHVLAPAKLNLFLHITGRKDNGYHLLQSAFMLIDWLAGKPTPAEGWNVDVSEWHLRRLVLERVQPAPRTVLRIAFES